jgi:hypothetical protein
MPVSFEDVLKLNAGNYRALGEPGVRLNRKRGYICSRFDN